VSGRLMATTPRRIPATGTVRGRRWDRSGDVIAPKD